MHTVFRCLLTSSEGVLRRNPGTQPAEVSTLWRPVFDPSKKKLQGGGNVGWQPFFDPSQKQGTAVAMGVATILTLLKKGAGLWQGWQLF